jgi:GT2 family glycosyltransferase
MKPSAIGTFEPSSKINAVSGTSLRLSIVLCSYNQVAFIRDALESLVKQKNLRPGELEIIVMDGGSTDGSAEIIQEYAEHCALLVSERDGGQTQALKNGFSRATGDILGWLCSDDVLEPNTVRFVLDYFRGHPDAEFMYGDLQVIGPKGEIRSTRNEIPFNWFIWKYDYNYIPQPSAFWRRGLYEEVNGLDETFDLCMDGDLWARFAERTRPRHVRRVLSSARSHPQTKTQRMERQSEDEYRRVCSRYGTDLANVPRTHALRLLAKVWRVGWKLTTGRYRWT